MTTPSLPDDIARCTGQDLDDCVDCLRRTAPPHNILRVVYMWPPKPIEYSLCEYYIQPRRTE